VGGGGGIFTLLYLRNIIMMLSTTGALTLYSEF
jgi:hypothetical protein